MFTLGGMLQEVVILSILNQGKNGFKLEAPDNVVLPEPLSSVLHPDLAALVAACQQQGLIKRPLPHAETQINRVRCVGCQGFAAQVKSGWKHFYPNLPVLDHGLFALCLTVFCIAEHQCLQVFEIEFD